MSLWKLIAYRLKIALAGFTRGQASRRAARIIGLCAVLAAVVLFVLGAYAFFTVLKSSGEIGTTVAAVMVTLTFNAILILALVFDIATTTNIFFLSSDLDLLMAAPLPTLRVFAVKYLEAMVSASFVALFIAFPILLGYGLAFHAPLIFFPAMFVVTAIFITIPISIGTICGMTISRYVPAAKVREILALLTGIIGLGVWLGFQAMRPAISSPGQIHDLSIRMKSLAAGGGNALFKMLPSRFPAEILTSLSSARISAALPPLLYLVVTAGIMFALSIVLAERIYLAGWTRTAPSGKKAKRAKRVRARPASTSAGFWRWLPPTERSILKTTTYLFIRDPQQITPIATLTIMMGVLPFFMGRQGRFAGHNPLVLLYSVLCLSFVGSMNLAMSAVVIDGRAFWRLLIAPSSSLKKLLAKLLVSASFFVPLASAVVVAFRIAGLVDWFFVPKAIWLAACLTALGASLGLLIGISYADWEWDIPKRMIKTWGRLILMFGATLFLVAAGFALRVFSSRGAMTTGVDAGWVVLLLVTAGAAIPTYLFLRVSSKKMDRMEWKL